MSRRRSLTTVGASSDHACDQCGAIAATIEVTPLGYTLLCERCDLPPTGGGGLEPAHFQTKEGTYQ